MLGTKRRLHMGSFRIGFLKTVAASLVLFPVGVHASDVSTRRVQCEGAKYRYILFAVPTEKPLPAIVLLHGAGDTPEPMIEAWRKLAKKENIALIAPELPRDVKFEPLRSE